MSKRSNVEEMKRKENEKVVFGRYRSNPKLNKKKSEHPNLRTPNYYSMISEGVTEDENFLSLSFASRYLLLLMYEISRKKYNKNGTVEDIKKVQIARKIYTKYGYTYGVFTRCIKELEEHGFIEKSGLPKGRNVADTYYFLDDWWKSPPKIEKSHEKYERLQLDKIKKTKN